MAYGKFESFEAFIDSYITTRKQEEQQLESELSFEARRGRRRRPSRDVVEVNARIRVVEPDDLDHGKHQHLKVQVLEVLDTDADVDADVQRHITNANELVFVSVRYGDRLGIPTRVPGLDEGVEVHMRGEWISLEKAYAHGGEKLSVLHFTHEPVGFICTPDNCYS